MKVLTKIEVQGCLCLFYLEYSSLWYGDEDNMSGEEPLDDICGEVNTFTFRFLGIPKLFFSNVEKMPV